MVYVRNNCNIAQIGSLHDFSIGNIPNASTIGRGASMQHTTMYSVPRFV
jgi:hypothetical protein